jgi:hypothetical protein
LTLTINSFAMFSKMSPETADHNCSLAMSEKLRASLTGTHGASVCKLLMLS